jgi:acylphosphatase
MQDMAVAVRVSGRVQGVMFRVWTREQAQALGLSGWVRNAPDGSVSALLAGPETQLREMLVRLGRGPALARVHDVAVTPAEKPEQDGFHIL